MFNKIIVKRSLLVITTALSIFIILSSCLTGNQSTEQSGFIVNLFKSIINFFSPDAINPYNIDSFSAIIRKLVGHFGLFLVLGIFTSFSFSMYINDISFIKKKRLLSIFIILTYGMLLAMLTERIQLFIPNRSGEIKDILIDFSGYLLSSFPILLFYKYRK